MNQQDREDFEQDFAICMITGKYSPTEVNSYRGFYARSRDLALSIKQARRNKLLSQYKYYLIITANSPLETFEKEELIFKVLEACNFLPRKQRLTVLAFLEFGDLVTVAEKLGRNYNTTKANFLHAVNALKGILT